MQEEQTQSSQVTTQTVSSPAPVVTGEHPQKAYTKKKAIFRIYQVIWYILGIIETLLVLRFILKALGANAGSGFANLIYVLSAPLTAPFKGIFQTAVVQQNIFEWSTLVAGAVYALVAFGLVQLFQLIKPTTPQEVEQKVSQ
jgi:YggT family protein